jgi:hypothetical protein
MNNGAHYSISTEIMSLPEVIATRNGFELDPRENMWRVPDSCKKTYFNGYPQYVIDLRLYRGSVA